LLRCDNFREQESDRESAGCGLPRNVFSSIGLKDCVIFVAMGRLVLARVETTMTESRLEGMALWILLMLLLMVPFVFE
jgi:hypothetical protein